MYMVHRDGAHLTCCEDAPKSGFLMVRIFLVFAVTRLAWFLMALWQSQRSIAVDWAEVGDFVTDTSFISRMMLFVSHTIIHMFYMPKHVRAAVSSFHPEKGYQPYCAFGGKHFGPRVFALGYATKDMYETETYHGVLTHS